MDRKLALANEVLTNHIFYAHVWMKDVGLGDNSAMVASEALFLANQVRNDLPAGPDFLDIIEKLINEAGGPLGWMGNNQHAFGY